MEPFIGQIQAFAFSFAPRGWSQCNGQLIQIASNTALFSLLGTMYGGDGRTTFALPDLRARAPINYGKSPRVYEGITQGERGGSQYTQLSMANLPTHNHGVTNTLAVQIMTSTSGYNTSESGAGENGLASGGSTPDIYTTNPTFGEYMTPETLVVTGSVVVNEAGQSGPFSIQQPSLGINYCIATTGIYPSRN